MKNMDGFEMIKQGAEARLYKGVYLGKPTFVKERFEKKYRHTYLDNNLTKERMKAECRAIVRCKSAGIYTPTVYLVDFKRRSIFMEFFEHSVTSKDFINASSSDLIVKLAFRIGAVLAKMHSNNIIHGDLTTSNILVANKQGQSEFGNFDDLDVVLIDFGLSHVDSSAEDKGVDLYVLERAIVSTHDNPDKIFDDILNAYKREFSKGYKEVFDKLEEIRARGRKRTMVG